MKWLPKSKTVPKNIAELKKILVENRDIDSNQKDFFNPQHPMDLKFSDVNIDKDQVKSVVKRIKQAKKNKEYILIFGDYDADGISATAILWQTLYEMGCDVKPFIPNRKEHGYGVSSKAIDEIISDRKPDLLITVDNGIVAHKPISYLKNQAIDVIVTDHHQPEMEMGKPVFPNADYVIHSSRLCGATVAWMLARELNASSKSGKEFSESLLDLCGIATIADQVKLIGPNRSFAKFGLKAIQETTRVGLRLLIKKIVRDPKSITSDTVGYILAPRINAVGRMADGIVALRFLCTKNKTQAKNLADVLIEINDNRKNLTYELLSHAEDQTKDSKDESIIIAHSDHYHEGILGLIAGAMQERHHKPAIAISLENGLARASARSIPGVNIVNMLREIRDELVEVGGHPMAAGFGFKVENLDSIKKRLFALAKETISETDLIKKIEPECVLPYKLVSDELIDAIDDFRPFGQGNHQPIFEIDSLNVLEVSTVGNQSAHLRLSLSVSIDKKNNLPISIKAIGWRMGRRSGNIKPGDKISVIGKIEHNVWNGNKSIQMVLDDFKLNS